MYRIPDEFESLQLPIGSKADDLYWYVLQTHSCEEVQSVQRLALEGFGAYCPLDVRLLHPRRVRRQRLSKREVKRPLFVRYIFVGFDGGAGQQQWLRVNEIDTVVGAVAMNGSPVRVPWEVLARIREAEDAGAFAVVEPDDAIRFEIGETVTLSGGVFGALPAVVTQLGRGRHKGEARIEFTGDAMLGETAITVPLHMLVRPVQPVREGV